MLLCHAISICLVNSRYILFFVLLRTQCSLRKQGWNGQLYVAKLDLEGAVPKHVDRFWAESKAA